MVAGAVRNSSIGGTVGYIGPEVLHQKCEPTHASDIYSLGVLLWTLATGKLPKGRDSIHANDDALAAIVVTICRMCLANDPKQRFQDAANLVGALSELEAR